MRVDINLTPNQDRIPTFLIFHNFHTLSVRFVGEVGLKEVAAVLVGVLGEQGEG